MPNNKKKTKGGKTNDIDAYDHMASVALISRVMSTCAGCGKDGGDDLKSCGSCGVMKYCSRLCQKRHWKAHHKNVCTQLQQLYQNSELGQRFANAANIGGKKKLRFKMMDRVKCAQGEWVPWAHGTITQVWGPGDSVYGVLTDDRVLLKVPEDDDSFIQKLSAAPKDAAEKLHDEALFKAPPAEEDCPICFLRFPIADSTYSMPCCGQTLCSGCLFAHGQLKNCPFCREKSLSGEEQIEVTKKRMELDNADAFHMLALWYDVGGNGLPQDSKKAHQLWSQGAELGSRDAHYNLFMSFSKCFIERGVEKDVKKAIYHLEMAAIKGDARSRCELGHYEGKMGNWDRAKKHWMLSAAAGCHSCMEGGIKKGYLMGGVTEDEYTKTLRTYRDSLDEMKSKQRDSVQSTPHPKDEYTKMLRTNRDSQDEMKSKQRDSARSMK
ncbi:hypothetical protein ACHAXR_005649 [Thalassiosira sp. AJA248-18]